MKIKTNEHRMLRRFHKTYFFPRFYRLRKRPDVIRFAKEDKCTGDVGRLKFILTMYTFHCWCLAYVIKAPSTEAIDHMFSKYTLKP